MFYNKIYLKRYSIVIKITDAIILEKVAVKNTVKKKEKKK